jgi:hypothetical protein
MGRAKTAEYSCAPTYTTQELNVHYAFISHGSSGNGAFTADGVARAACPAAGASADASNCINDAEFVQSACMGNRVTGVNFYDDMTQSKSNPPSRMWQDTVSASQDIISNAESVGINTSNPQAALHVTGNIKALNTDSNTICAENGSGCFTATMIGGTDPLMKCGSNPGATSSAMSGIGEARAKCQSGYTAFRVECPDGEFIRALDTNGGLICGN